MSGDDAGSTTTFNDDYETTTNPESDGDYYDYRPYTPYKTRAMKEERDHFFKEALKFLMEDVVNLLRRQILIIKEIETADFNKKSVDADRYLDALEIIKEQVNQNDIITQYHQMGGFAIFPSCFRCPCSIVRASSFDLLSQMCHDNSLCKQIVTNSDLLHLVLTSLESEEEPIVSEQILHAINSVIKDNPQGYKVFQAEKGFERTLQLLQKDDDKLRSKTAFFLTTIGRTEPNAKMRMVCSGYLPALLTLLSGEYRPSNERLLELLVAITKDNKIAIEQLRNTSTNMVDFILECWQASKGVPNYEEIEEQCLELLSVLNLPEIT